MHGQLHIWDYKFGRRHVEAFENWQLIEYAAGILMALEINGHDDQYIRVNLHIVQPRSISKNSAIRSWNTFASELRAYFNILRDRELASMAESASCLPSPECSYCQGRHACQALQRSALSAVDLSLMNSPWELSSTEIGNELRYLKHAAELLDARITGLSEQATARLKNGQRIPFFSLEAGSGRERWKVPAEEIVPLGEIFGIDLVKSIDVITPRQAVKLGIPEEVVKSYTERPITGLKLIQNDGSQSRKIFGVKNEK